MAGCGWLAGWLVDSLVGWLVGWFVCLLVGSRSFLGPEETTHKKEEITNKFGLQ